MKPIFLLLVVALSAVPTAGGATRPHFGGALRVEMSGAISSFDITDDPNAARAFLRNLIVSNVCDRLVTLSANGEPQPSLATSWRSERDGRSWFFTIREGVTLHNGSILTPQMIITALTARNSDWRARATGSDLLIQSDVPIPGILYQLADPQDSICLTNDDGQWIGTGPFQISGFQAGRQVELRSFDDCWQGRSFLDSVRILMGRSLADQAADLQLGRAELIENDPTQPRQVAGAITSLTEPIELLALVFTANHPAVADGKLREAMARALDRDSIHSVLLRKQGQPSAALLPKWISGYGHLFRTIQDLASARQLRNQARSLGPLSLAFEANDDLARLIAERVSLNSREAGIALQPRSETPAFRSFNADVRLVRLGLESPEGGAALARIGSVLNLSSLQKADTAATEEALYRVESEALSGYSIIPIAHIPASYSLAPSVHDWTMTRWGEIRLSNLWIEAGK